MTLLDPLHIAATQDFINENPVAIVPMRRARVSTGTGGYTLGAPVAQPALVVRKVGLNSVTGVQERVTPDGKSVIITANVIAAHDSGIEVNDYFAIGADTYVVNAISFDPPWRLRAEVYQRG